MSTRYISAEIRQRIQVQAGYRCGERIVGITPCGCATVIALQLNNVIAINSAPRLDQCRLASTPGLDHWITENLYARSFDAPCALEMGLSTRVFATTCVPHCNRLYVPAQIDWLRLPHCVAEVRANWRMVVDDVQETPIEKWISPLDIPCSSMYNQSSNT